MVEFFETIRNTLIGKSQNVNLTDAEQLLVLYEDKFNAEKNRGFQSKSTDTTNEELYNNSKGAGNPINRKTITKLLTVDSRFRNNYQNTLSTDYNIDLPYIINNVIEMKLSDVEFPTTYYPFDDEYENNYCWIKYTYINSSNIEQDAYIYIYIPSGNYYHQTLIDNISNDFMNLALPFTINFNLDYNNAGGIGVGDGKVTIQFTTDTSTNFVNVTNIVLNFEASKLPPEIEDWNTSHRVYLDEAKEYYNIKSNIDYKQRFGWMLGYRKPYYTGALSYVSEGILDVLGPKYLYLLVEDFNTSSNINFFSNSEETLLNGMIIARISLKGYAFAIQSQGDFGIYTEPRFYYGPVNIHKLHVKIIDEYGRRINLNGIDFSFTLNLTTIYSQTN